MAGTIGGKCHEWIPGALNAQGLAEAAGLNRVGEIPQDHGLVNASSSQESLVGENAKDFTSSVSPVRVLM
jgi:hypothetical protein